MRPSKRAVLRMAGAVSVAPSRQVRPTTLASSSSSRSGDNEWSSGIIYSATTLTVLQYESTTTMEDKPAVRQTPCARCTQSSWRLDWDFLKEVFQREQSLQQEMQTLVSQHTYDYQALHGQLTALQLTHYSISAHLQQAEQQRDALQLENIALRSQVDDLNTQYNHLFGRLCDAERDHGSTQERYHELYQTCQAQESVLAQQSAALEKQAAELDAAHVTASKLGKMLDTLLSASDFASEAFGAAIEVADVMMRNKYQELTIAKLQHKIECFTGQADSDAVSCGCCSSPTLCRCRTPLSSRTSLTDATGWSSDAYSPGSGEGSQIGDEESIEEEMTAAAADVEIKGEDSESIHDGNRDGGDQDGGFAEGTMANEAWYFYREQHPLRLDDYEP